jgi:processive 1,2-diacylglycerol beta-glucosyltransferase
MDKRVLILSVPKGSGHQQAANALEKAFRSYYPEVEVVNANFFDCTTNPFVERVVNRTYLTILKTTPEIWDYLYDNDRLAEWSAKFREYINKRNSAKFINFLVAYSPHAVICTQAFPCGVISAMKRNSQIKVPLVAVITDFEANTYWPNEGVDLYTVATEFTKDRLCARGIPESQVQILGIPVDQIFSMPCSPQQLREKIGISAHLKTVLVMGGSLGFGPIPEIIEELFQCQSEFQILVITGLNKKLEKELESFVSTAHHPLYIFGFIDNVNELMTISDLIITKPGGLTSTEALLQHLPMLIVKPIPGQEEKNSQFLVNLGVAIRTDEMNEVSSLVDSLFLDETRLTGLREKIRMSGYIDNPAKRVAGAVMKLIAE